MSSPARSLRWELGAFTALAVDTSQCCRPGGRALVFPAAACDARHRRRCCNRWPPPLARQHSRWSRLRHPTPRTAVSTLAATTRGVACAEAHATSAAGVRFAIASRLAAAAARQTLLSSSPLPHASPPLVALRGLTSAGTLSDCAPLLRCLRWSCSRQSAACHRCSDSAGACCRHGASRGVLWRSAFSAAAMGADALAAGALQCGATGRALVAAAVRFASSSPLLSPLSVDSDQATATGTAAGHTHKRKARKHTTRRGIGGRGCAAVNRWTWTRCSGVAPQLQLAAAAVRSSSSLLLSPLSVDSDQATATGTASDHTHKQKARSTKHSGVAARTRLRRERGGNSFQLAQLQPTTPKHTGASRQPRSRGCWLDITAEENHSSNANY